MSAADRGASLPRLRALHVAALPFPTHQGTQAAIHRMLSAIASNGERPRLATYLGGGDETKAGFEHVRVPGTDVRSLRSGPSLEKVRADVALYRALARLADGADVVVAHHVEAALVALSARVRPVLFVAHTALGPELPTYFHPALGALLTRAGGGLDHFLVACANAVAAVSPALARDLSRRTGRVVHALPIPWPLAAPIAAGEREAARASLGVAADADVVLYAGNLDAYQGLETLGDALERLASANPRLVFLLATAGPRAEMVRLLGPRARARLLDAPLDSEASRRVAHAAASVAVVPRRSPGGLPVKLLDALARGVPTVAVERALAGHGLEGALWVAPNDDGEALAVRITAALRATPEHVAERTDRGRVYLATECSDAAFRDAFRRALANAALRA